MTDSENPSVARVIVDVAAAEVDRVFDYTVPQGMEVVCGSHVRVPFGRRHIEGFVVGMGTHSEVGPDRLREIECTLESYPALLPELIELAKQMQSKYQCRLVDALRVMLPAQMRGMRVNEKEERVACLALSAEETGAREEELKRAPKQREALRALLSAGGELGLADASRMGFDGACFSALERKGFVRIDTRELLRRPAGTLNVQRDEPKESDMYQRRAIERISASIGRGGTYLLHGVTGCGKTEVYMQCASKALALGKSVIILVPEISLTPQMTQRFVARFGALAAVLHSRLSPGERFDEWRRIRRGEARVVVGARSAIFAPAENLGLIVIDEEHEQTYESEHTPRYRADEIAKLRSARTGAPLVLGSATPSVGTYYDAVRGDIELIEMPKRIGGRPLPDVIVVDMRLELRGGNRGVMSSVLREELRKCLEARSQAILLLNRRGFNTFVSCRDCGEAIKCDLCDVPMTYHKVTGKLKCHYCGADKPLPLVCPHCGSDRIRYFGDGTQKLEEELKAEFGEARVLRMDADTTKGKDAHMIILDKFRRREADILLGTQMIAKGLDFPDVTLVGVAAVDSMLFMPDFRSTERAYELMAQVAGRAGRADKRGRVVLQTYSPEHVAVKCAAAHDYASFYAQEIEARKRGQYPPFAHIVRAVCANEDARAARDDALWLREAIEGSPEGRHAAEAMLFSECMSAPVGRINAMYRHQLLMKLKTEDAACEILSALAQISALPRKSALTVEKDPQSMV